MRVGVIDERDRQDHGDADFSGLGQGRGTASPPRLHQSYPSPAWAGGIGSGRRVSPLTLDGELVAKSTGTVSDFGLGDRVFHQKFGYGNVVAVDGNKLTIQFDKAGEKRVVDSFVERA